MLLVSFWGVDTVPLCGDRYTAAHFLLGALPISVVVGGCEPSCTDVCEKLLSCSQVGTTLISEEDCTSSCLTQELLYEESDDTDKLDAFGDLKVCIDEQDCDQLYVGVCYDPDLYIW